MEPGVMTRLFCTSAKAVKNSAIADGVMQSCCCSDEVTNWHCEVGEVVGFMSELTQVIHASHVARATRTRGGADVLRRATVEAIASAVDVLLEEGRATRARGAAEVVNEVDFNF